MCNSVLRYIKDFAYSQVGLKVFLHGGKWGQRSRYTMSNDVLELDLAREPSLSFSFGERRARLLSNVEAIQHYLGHLHEPGGENVDVMGLFSSVLCFVLSTLPSIN